MDALIRFRKIFWDAFHRPKLETETFANLWQQLESVNNLLAGPLYAIFTNGNCDYMFNDKHRFPGVNTADDVLNWCISFIEQYKEGISSKLPSSVDEEKDQEILFYQTDLKMELADLAYTILLNQREVV
jgi:hypothetical protein